MNHVFSHEGENGVTVKITAPSDVNAAELAETFAQYMLAVGYHPETVKETFTDGIL